MRITTILVLNMQWLNALADWQPFAFDASTEHPFGQINPDAPSAVSAFQEMIGVSQCESLRRIDQANWAPPENMLWRFKYIMNGMAIQDETLKADGVHSGSIRQFDAKTQEWQVHYYSMGSTTGPLPNWVGGQEGDDLVFKRNQAAPNGMAGMYRLTFANITAKGFDWVGEWVSEDGSVVYPTWKITCHKQTQETG